MADLIHNRNGKGGDKPINTFQPLGLLSETNNGDKKMTTEIRELIVITPDNNTYKASECKLAGHVSIGRRELKDGRGADANQLGYWNVYGSYHDDSVTEVAVGNTSGRWIVWQNNARNKSVDKLPASGTNVFVKGTGRSRTEVVTSDPSKLASLPIDTLVAAMALQQGISVEEMRTKLNMDD